MKRIKIFDTTLRDGEQSPGCSMNNTEKLEMARQLEILKVDIIEAGFAISSKGDFDSVKAIAEEIKNSSVASLARCIKADIDAAWEAIRNAAEPRIHIFLATSPLHMQYKLKKTPDDVYSQAIEAVKYAKRLTGNVEFSAEDASRSDPDFLCKVLNGAIEAGATTVNIPDTVGYMAPDEFFKLIEYVRNNVPLIDMADISVHCHNDLGLAVANSLAAIKAGATQVECTINGIGERAGNAAMEELVMNLYSKKEFYDAFTGIDSTQLYRSSRLLSQLTGVKVQPNKAVVGENAFAHESGIHQHGVLANRATYEIMTPESVGVNENKMVLGKHSGRHALRDRIVDLGYHIKEDELDKIFDRFKALADKKKSINDRDVEALVRDTIVKVHETYRLERYVINAGNTITTTSIITLIRDDGVRIEKVASGSGTIEASYNAINKITELGIILEEYSINAVTGGEDAQGEVSVKIRCDDVITKGYGLSQDILQASINAYVDAINKMIYENRKEV